MTKVTTEPGGVSGRTAVSILVERRFTDAVIIPDSESAALYEALLDEDAIAVLSPTREGEGIAIAAGLLVGGRKPIVVIQNTGLMEAGDALRGCGLGPRIPLRLLVGWRGYAGAMAGRAPIDSAYPYTEPLLAAWGVPTRRLMSDEDLGVIAEMDDEADRTELPSAVLTGWAFR